MQCDVTYIGDGLLKKDNIFLNLEHFFSYSTYYNTNFEGVKMYLSRLDHCRKKRSNVGKIIIGLASQDRTLHCLSFLKAAFVRT